MSGGGISEAWALVVELAVVMKGAPLKDTVTGLWVCEVDADWHVTLNPHPDAIAPEPGGVPVPGYHVVLRSHEWPAGIIGPGGGLIVCGGGDEPSEAEAALIVALKLRIGAERQSRAVHNPDYDEDGSKIGGRS